MKFEATDNTGNRITVEADTAHEAYMAACNEMQHAPVRLEPIHESKE